MAPRGHRRWWVVAAIAVLVVVVGVAGALVVPYLLRAHPGPMSMGSAVKGFKGGGSGDVGKDLAYPPPGQGVYRLVGQGSERINVPPNSQADGRTMPASVTYLPDGCWRWHVDYNVAHWEEYDFCPQATRTQLPQDRNSQRWDFGTIKVTNLAVFTCGPGATVLPGRPVPGQTIRWACTGTNTSVSGHTFERAVARIVGTPSLRIAGAAVPTVEERQQVTLTGGQRGTVTEDWWFTRRSGLPVRMVRHITILSGSPIGTVTYREAGTWQMASLVPRTRGATSS